MFFSKVYNIYYDLKKKMPELSDNFTNFYFFTMLATPFLSFLKKNYDILLVLLFCYVIIINQFNTSILILFF